MKIMRKIKVEQKMTRRKEPTDDPGGAGLMPTGSSGQLPPINNYLCKPGAATLKGKATPTHRARTA